MFVSVLGLHLGISHAVLFVLTYEERCSIVCSCFLFLQGECHSVRLDRLLLLGGVRISERGSGRWRWNNIEPVALDAVDRENYVLVDLLMHWEFTGLAEGSRAPFIVALERFLLRVDVRVFLQVLGQSKGLETEDTDVLFDRRMWSDVSPEREARSVGLITAWHLTFIWSFHDYNFFALFSKEVEVAMLIIIIKQ